MFYLTNSVDKRDALMKVWDPVLRDAESLKLPGPSLPVGTDNYSLSCK